MESLTSLAPTELAEADDRRVISDRRGAPRKKILRSGRTVWQNGDSTECIIHNLSETGAHLEIRGPVPKTIDLVVDGDQSRRSCWVVWRKANRIGVKFQDPSQFVGMPVESMTSTSAYIKHADECRMLAKRAEPLDRETLLKMAESWEAAARRFRKKIR
jgi:PilZ domain